jgi:hypothetical protein
MGRPTASDWGKIHAKAWREPAFRKLLETDPTAAVNQYAKEAGKKFDKLVKLHKKPAGVPSHKFASHGSAKVPPACC